jgi:peptidoglycan/xylan/chitin deacetylase (PgdA/CDA1 family)
VSLLPRLRLTFDDGPDPVWTPRLLEALSRHRARATFFPLSERAAAAPDLIERMAREGHGIGLHAHEHVRHSDRDRHWLQRDTARAMQELAAVGVVPRLWRPPWGDVAPWTRQVAAVHGLELVGWDADTHDWRGDSAEAMYAVLADAPDGAIVLAHDGIGPGARRADCRETIALVELLGAGVPA